MRGAPYVHECSCGNVFTLKTSVMIHELLHHSPTGMSFHGIASRLVRPRSHISKAVNELLELNHARLDQGGKFWLVEHAKP